MRRTSKSEGQHITEPHRGKGPRILAFALALAGVPWGVFLGPASPPPQRENPPQGAALRAFLERVNAETQPGDQILLILPAETADETALYRARYLLTGRNLDVRSVDDPSHDRIDPDWVAAWQVPLPSSSGQVVFQEGTSSLSKGLR